MPAFPATKEFTHTDTEKIEAIHSIFSECTFYDAHEGALIRIFNFEGRWFTSTHRKLNAFRSKWASRESFGAAFKKALDSEVQTNTNLRERIPDGDEGLLARFQSTLDPKKQYMFLVRHSADNRIVNGPPERPTVYHVGTFLNRTLVMTEDIGIPYPRKHTFPDMKSLLAHVEETDIRLLQGIMCFGPEGKQYKILNQEYKNLFDARGNEPSIKFRYLNVRMNQRMVDMLYHLYPEKADDFEEIENIIFAICKKISDNYVARYINKTFLTVPKDEFVVMKACHEWHEQDRTNRVKIDKVITEVNKQHPTALNKMIRRWRSEKAAKDENKNVAQERTRANTIGGTPRTDPTEGPALTSPLLLSQNRRRRQEPPDIALPPAQAKS